MAKKRSSALFTNIDKQTIEKEQSISSFQENIKNELNSSEPPVQFLADSHRILTIENKEKLEQYENVLEENKKLIAEKDLLTDQISKYLDELDELRLKSNNIDCLSSNIILLENKIKTLQDENDSQLLKISQLTFENANLKYKLQEQHSTPNNTTIQSLQNNKKQSNNVSYINKTYINNGYQSWN